MNIQQIRLVALMLSNFAGGMLFVTLVSPAFYMGFSFWGILILYILGFSAISLIVYLDVIYLKSPELFITSQLIGNGDKKQ